MDSNTQKHVTIDLSPIIKRYSDGTIQRLVTFPYVQPSPSGHPISSKDITITPQLSARLYLPKPTHSNEKLPIYIYFHGGGFCIGSSFGSLDHNYMSHLSRESRALIVSVDYRLAPENLLPAAYDDGWSALQWVYSHADNNNNEVTRADQEPWIVDHGNFNRVFVGGESAGGNIAHNLVMRVGLNGEFRVYGAILSHPGFWGSRLVSGELRKDVGEHMLDRMLEFVYPDCPGGIDGPDINPIGDGAPSLEGYGCERVLVCASEKDELTDYVLGFVEKLKGSGWGGEIELVVVQGEDHCFHVYDTQTSDKARDLIKRMASFLSR